VNIDHVESVATLDVGVIIVARRGKLRYSINVPRSEVTGLVAKLQLPDRRPTPDAAAD
jgi:hypothetical protein